MKTRCFKQGGSINMYYKHYHRTLMIAVASAGVLVLTAAAAPKIGDSLPDLGKAELKGTIPDMEGKIVLVDFWASWCGPCRQSFPVMDKIYQEYKSKGLVVLAISVDEDATAMEQFLKKHPVSFPILHDVKQKLVESAGIETMPTSFLVDRKGKIVAVHNGFSLEKTEAELRREIQQQIDAEEGGKTK
ncbi:MAG: redoxin [Verrucomicrobia bacterium]|nr:redoxin [Verrucomicrobiota bacterium]